MKLLRKVGFRPPVGAPSGAVSLINRSMLFLAVAAGFAQIIIGTDTTNLLCVLMAVVGVVFGQVVVLREEVVRTYPVSSLSYFGAMVTMLWSPLVFTTVELKPVIFQLQVPLKTFGWSLVVCFVLGMAHYAYRVSGAGRFSTEGVSKIWRPLGVFDRPSDLTFWLMAAVGLPITIYFNVFKQQDAYTVGIQGAGSKLALGFFPFAYAPLVLLALPSLQTQRVALRMGTVIAGALYLLGMLAIAVYSNVRMLFAGPMLSVMLAFLLIAFLGRLRIGSNQRALLLCCVPVGLFALAQLSDLALAMRAARTQRGMIDATVLMQDTVRYFMDKKYLSEYREELKSGDENLYWSEYYVSSPFLSRFILTKFIDNSLNIRDSLDSTAMGELRDISNQRIWSTLPDPVVRAVNPSVNKLYVTSFSMGDFMFGAYTGSYIPSFKTGSMVGHGLIYLSYLFPVLLFVLAFGVYIFFDSLTQPTKLAATGPPQAGMQGSGLPQSGLLIVSPLVFIFIYDFFYFWGNESFSGFIVTLIRGFLQKVIFYVLLLNILKRVAPR
jgi:hypothetical protein